MSRQLQAPEPWQAVNEASTPPAVTVTAHHSLDSEVPCRVLPAQANYSQ